MTLGTETKTLRQGSAHKRTAIERAALELFLADGFERTSVDAIAAQAGVSKRTVYDYFGDKRTLLISVVEQTGASLMETIDGAIHENLDAVTASDGLEPAFVAFSRRIMGSTFGSPDYIALTRLLSAEAAHVPALRDHWMSEAPETAIAARLAEFDRRGWLSVPDPRLAADHFTALTFLLAFNKYSVADTLVGPEVDRMIVGGVRAFLRAYAPRG